VAILYLIMIVLYFYFVIPFLSFCFHIVVYGMLFLN